MKNLSLTLLIFLMFAFTVVGQQPTTYYVNETGADDANGTSWSDAFPTLQAALTKAGDYDEIRIAKGVYKPSVNPVGAGDNNHHNITFLITKNVKIYGGFRGDNENETLEARDLINNETVLSGDIDNTPGQSDGDAYHVVVIVGTSEQERITPTLDGLTITGGNSYYLLYFGQTVSINGQPVDIGRGGGIHNRFANPIIKDVTVKGNAAYDGGGIYNDNSHAALYDVTISGNKARSGGGGIFNNNSFPTLTNVSIVNNESRGEFTSGGGMNNSNSNPTLTNVTIAGNKAAYYGGGMYNSMSDPTLTNVTITGNKAEDNGGGMYNIIDSSPKIFNSIIWGNKSDSNGNNVYNLGSNPKYDYTLVEGANNAWSEYGDEGEACIVFSGSASELFIEPTTSNLPTSAGNYRLAAGSPAIDGGLASHLKGVNTDLDGKGRFNNTRPDMGAYEYQQITPADGKIIYVNANVPLGDNTGSSWSTALPTLGEALDYINADYSDPLEGYTINVAGGTYYPTTKVEYDDNQPTTDRDKTFLLLSDVAIYGGYSGKDDKERDIKQYKTILSGDIDNTPGQSDGDAYHVVVMVGSNDNRITPTLNGLTITGGYSFGSGSTSLTINGQQIYQPCGGGIYNRLADPYIQDATIIGNKVGNLGGGILNDASSPALTNVLINGNSSSIGGGMININSRPILTNVTISGNRSLAGGGMVNTNSGPILTNVTISGNYASGDNDNPGMGGGIVSTGAYNNPIIRNSIIWGNIAEGDAAGNDIINLDDSDPQFYHSLVGGDGDWNSDWGTGDDTNIIAGLETQLFVGYIDPTTLTLPTTDGDYHLAAGSPAIDAGSTYPGMVMTDLDGKQRDDKPDMGAYEYVQINTTPPPSPNPTYTINVPEVEGVTTTPGAGLYEVKPGNSFEISITPGDEYDESELLIYANDILLQPVATGSEPVSYTYRIANVESAVTFRIEGVQKNDEVTGIDSPGSTPNYRLYTQPGLLMIDAALPGDLTITAIDGRTITRQRITEGTTRVSLPAGVYVVRIGDGNYKVVVRSK